MTIQEAKELLAGVRPYFYRYEEPVKVYIHWTAGDYDTTFDDYHFCITGDGDIKNTRDLRSIPSATWKRNTGSIAIAICACKGAEAYAGSPNYARLGDFPPTDDQLDACALLMAAISDVFDIPIDIEHFLTHGEAADNADGEYYHEPYGQDSTCERWDLAVLDDGTTWGEGGNILRGMAAYAQKHGLD